MSDPMTPTPDNEVTKKLAEAVFWHVFDHVDITLVCRCPHCGGNAIVRIGGNIEAPWGCGLFNCSSCGSHTRLGKEHK